MKIQHKRSHDRLRTVNSVDHPLLSQRVMRELCARFMEICAETRRRSLCHGLTEWSDDLLIVACGTTGEYRYYRSLY
jgi:hypothetical protein